MGATLPHSIYISAQQHYGCLMCGRCCRRFHVLLRPDEIERLSKLDWGDEENVPSDFSHVINGFPYFRRKPEDGACVFLDDAGVCRMHRRFGFDKKAMTCRGYPFNIVSTFHGEVSVLARMDCPAVLLDNGEPIRNQKKDIERLVSELHFGKGFTERQLQGMDKQAVLSFRDSLQGILDDESLNMRDCALMLMSLCKRAEQLGGIFLSDSQTMREVYPSLLKSLRDDLPELPKYGLGLYAKLIFRQLLGFYARRDEEILDTGIRTRIRMAWNMARVCLGGGNLANFGYEHPDCLVRKAALFNNAPLNVSRDVWRTYRKFLSVRFECLQFFGVSYYSTDIFSGLKALVLTYPLAVAFAKIKARSKGSDSISEEDVQYAVSAIDHCHGRSPALRFSNVRFRERALFNSYSELVFALSGE